jgi:hypothetical protein
MARDATGFVTTNAAASFGVARDGPGFWMARIGRHALHHLVAE